jgi:hypothetical protein
MDESEGLCIDEMDALFPWKPFDPQRALRKAATLWWIEGDLDRGRMVGMTHEEIEWAYEHLADVEKYVVENY